MGKQDVDLRIAEQFQAVLLIGLNIVWFCLLGGGGPSDATDAEDGDDLLPALKDVGNPRFEAPVCGFLSPTRGEVAVTVPAQRSRP